MIASWYDVLGVDPEASSEEIREAWRTAIADLDPTDRRFRSLNQAAEVLLDPAKRSAHDAALAEQERAAEDDLPATDGEPEAAPERIALAKAGNAAEVAAAPDAAPAIRRPAPAASGTSRTPRSVPTWLLALAAALAIALTVTAAVVGVKGGGDTAIDDADAQQALQVAVRAIGPVLSYDYRHLDEDAAQARSYMTASYQDQYDKTFALVKENAPSVKAVVSAQVIDAGVVRTGGDRVDVLVFVNRPTTNKKTTTPVVYKDQVTVTMVRDGESWLIDDLATSGVS